MFQKNSAFHIFSSCCSGLDKENETTLPLTKIKSNSFRKDPKISLKRSRQRSAKSSSESTHTKELKPQEVQQSVTPLRNHKKHCLSDLTQLLNQPSLQKINESSKTWRVITTISPELPETKKFVHFKYLSQNQSKNWIQQQKTIKDCYLNKQGNYKAYESTNMGLRKTRVLNKENFIKNLEDYKDSMVSIHVQTEPLHLQMQESSILIDYFNPSQSRVVALEEFVGKKE